jgi:succinyl-CoA synthetase alpha subunit
MSILVDENTNVLVQGITGKIGMTQTELMLQQGTKIVAGVTPGKAGQQVHDVPVYDSVEEVLSEHRVDASILFVPPRFTEDSCFEAIDAGIKVIVLITEHVPVHNTMRVRAYAKSNGVTVIGPTTPGIISPGKTKIGIMPMNMFCPGSIGLVSRSGTLTYEVAGALCEAGLGQSTAVGMGADPVVCTDLVDFLYLFEGDDETKAVVIVGEVGGTQEEAAAEFIQAKMSKPVVAYVAGRHAPVGKRMGHAGAIVQSGKGDAQSKLDAFKRAGAEVAENPMLLPQLVQDIL